MSGGSCCQPAVPSQGWHRGGHGHRRLRALLQARKEGGKRESGLLLLFSTPGVGLVGITARLGSAQGREPVWGRGQDARGVPGSEDAVLEKRSEEQGPREITAPKSPSPRPPTHLRSCAARGLSLVASHGHRAPRARRHLCCKLPGSALGLASLDSSVALVFSMLEGARGPSHGCFVPAMDSSQESR